MRHISELEARKVPRGNTPEYVAFFREVVNVTVDKLVLAIQAYELVDVSYNQFCGYITLCLY